MSDTTKLSSMKKWEISLIAALLFVIVSSPFVYSLTDKVSTAIGFDTTLGRGPTIPGLILHFVVFLLVFRLILHFVA